MERILIFANGALPDLNRARRLLQPNDYIICADGGTRHALALAVQPDLIIGDMDSADDRHLQELITIIVVSRGDKNVQYDSRAETINNKVRGQVMIRI